MYTLLQDKLSKLSVPDSICRLIMTSCQTGSSMLSWGNTSLTLRPSATDTPQGCVLSLLLFSLPTASHLVISLSVYQLLEVHR